MGELAERRMTDGFLMGDTYPLELVPTAGPRRDPASPGAEDLISGTVLAAIRDGVVVLRCDGEIAAVNQAMCDMTGFGRDELVGARAPLPYWPPEQLRQIAYVRAATSSGGEGEFDMTFVRKNGERFPAIVAIGASREHDARVVVIKDVTERQLLIEQLNEAKQDAEGARLAFSRSAEVIGEFLYSAEVLPDDSWVMHAQGPGNAELLGTDPGDPGAPTSRRLHPDDRAAFDRSWSHASLLLLHGEIVEQRYRLVGYDGVTRWIRDRARVTILGRRVMLNGAASDVSAQQRAEEQRAEAVGRLEWLSTIDHLTGLFNRRHFSEQVRTRSSEGDAAMAIAIVDIDRFKRINDEHGHRVGDGVLREVAERLRQSTRSSDLISRWGGEEFCILLGAVHDDHDMELRAERLRTAVTSTPVDLPDGTSITVTVSVGVARARRGRRTDDLFGDADAALYEAKRAGRNRTRVACAETPAIAAEHPLH
jgi:diguanylate cyclase (GGDEF)-like protein/PAS domain S-box-containing protein